MDKTAVISLNGQSEQFRLDGDAYDLLSSGISIGPAARLPDDSDRAEVLGDLERSVGDKLVAAARFRGPGGHRRRHRGDPRGDRRGRGRRRRRPGADAGLLRAGCGSLHRIRAGKQLAGVCTGLAAYADLDVSWVPPRVPRRVRPDRGPCRRGSTSCWPLSCRSPRRPTAPSPQRDRRLERIREGQQIAGVCNGLAAYAEINVNWVRALFLFATAVTAGGFLLVYAVLAFMLPDPRGTPDLGPVSGPWPTARTPW